jgi:hypothetical protein
VYLFKVHHLGTDLKYPGNTGLAAGFLLWSNGITTSNQLEYIFAPLQ